MNQIDKNTDDTFLLQALKRGSEESFELLFKKYSGRLYYVAFQYLNNREETIEIVQEVFYKIWINHSKIQPELPFVPYIIRIAKNLIINQSKRKLVENAYYQTIQNGNSSHHNETDDHLHYAEIKDLINELVNKFPDRRKEVFLLSRSKGLTNKEISARLSISESTVENHINKALNSLRVDLKNAGYLGATIFLLQVFF